MSIVNQFSRQQICRLNSVLNKPMIYFVCSSSIYHLNAIAWERYVVIQKFTYYKDIVNYKKSPPKTLDSRMVFSRVHAGLRSYNSTVVEVDREVVQMQFLFTAASTVALICLIAIAYFYIMNAISQVNDALINAKMESKIARTTALLTAALICSFLPSIGITLLGTVYPAFTTNSLSRLMEAMVQLNSLVSPLLYS